MDIATMFAFLGVIAAFIFMAWYLGHRMGRLETGYNNLTKVTNGLLNLFGTAIGLFHSRKALTDAEFSDILKSYIEMACVPETVSTPLTEDEVARINNYLAKAHRGEFFSPDEVLDYNNLVTELEKQKKGDPSVWPFVALGAFLLGLFVASLASKKEN
ncbi:hypothetical protein M1N05_02300 [Dehalococcoidales bacterium]|nr:hypothetical protein [Dehalococcoidales bacterium]MCL0091458.1 hypothetical protein [Dehalococcoidales bacterium]